MQMKALRSLNLAKLSSSNSTRVVYWVTSISAGTPAGYCLSQMRSMVFPLWFRAWSVLMARFLALGLFARKRYGARLFGRAGLFWAVLSKAAAHGKRLRLIGAAWTNH